MLQMTGIKELPVTLIVLGKDGIFMFRITNELGTQDLTRKNCNRLPLEINHLFLNVLRLDELAK